MAESVRGLEGKGRRLSVVAETVLNDINSNFSNSSGELQRLLPIQRKLTEVQQDVKDLLEALTCIVEDDMQLKRLCLSDRAAALASVPGVAGPGAVAGKRTHKPGFKELRGAEGGYSRKGDGAGQRSPAMRMAAAILESYEFKLTAVHVSDIVEWVDLAAGLRRGGGWRAWRASLQLRTAARTAAQGCRWTSPLPLSPPN